MIEELIKRIDIVKEISSYIELKTSGANYLGRCPFHDDSTPSLSVSEQKKIWRCFGCGKGGDVVKFISLYENVSYMEALEKLATKYNIPINIRAKEKDAEIYKVMKIVSEFYQNELIKNPQALSYVKERNINPKTIEEFGIGYSPNHYKLIDYLKNISDHYLNLYKSTQNLSISPTNMRDIFSNRIIFPIKDASSRVLGFGGRVISKDESVKYLNSPDSDIFKKSKLLFGINLSLDYIKERQEAVLVEGYFDVLRLYQIGIKNIVATLGTAFGTEHAKILSKYAKRAYLFFDSDNAGKSASLRTAKMLLSANIQPLYVEYSEKDPDEFGLKYDKKGVLELLSKARNYLDIAIESKNIELSLELVSNIQDPQVIYEYTQKLISMGIPKNMIEDYITANLTRNKTSIKSVEKLSYDIPMKDKIVLKALKECNIDIDLIDIEWINKDAVIIAEKIKEGMDLTDEELLIINSVKLPKEVLEKQLFNTLKEQNTVDKDRLLKIENTLSRRAYLKKYYLTHGKS